MNRLSFLVAILFTSTAWTSSSSEDELIIWHESRNLLWSDFRGAVDEHSHADAAIAVNITARPIRKGKKIYYNVEASFIPGKSWYRSKSERLLRHEQLHFDIAELYARKTRKKISEYRQMGVTEVVEINKAISRVLQESNEADLKYDFETLHGSLTTEQEKWERAVHLELHILRNFSSDKWR